MMRIVIHIGLLEFLTITIAAPIKKKINNKKNNDEEC